MVQNAEARFLLLLYYYSFRINVCVCVCVSILALDIRLANRIFSASYSIIICVWPVHLYSK